MSAAMLLAGLFSTDCIASWRLLPSQRQPKKGRCEAWKACIAHVRKPPVATAPQSARTEIAAPLKEGDNKVLERRMSRRRGERCFGRAGSVRGSAALLWALVCKLRMVFSKLITSPERTEQRAR